MSYLSIYQVKCKKYFLNHLLTSQITRLPGKQTGLADSIKFWAKKLDKGWFSYLFYQQIVFPGCKLASQHTYQSADMLPKQTAKPASVRFIT